MTYRIVSDHEVALQMKIDVQGKALQKSMNEVNELRKQLAELEEFIEASRKQERVGIVKQKRYANGTFVLWNKYPSAEMELFAAPVVAPDDQSKLYALIGAVERSVDKGHADSDLVESWETYNAAMVGAT